MVQWDGLHPDAKGDSDQAFVKQMTELGQMSEIEQDDYLARLSRQSLFGGPWRAVRLGVVKTARTWSPVPLSSEYARPLYQVVGLIFALPFYGLLLAGLRRANLSRKVKVMLLTPAVYFTFVHALTVGSLRYRVPVEPLLAVIGASSVSAVRKPVDAP
jgi:hypothetical protein